MNDNRRPRLAGVVVAGLLLAGGGSALGWAGTHQDHAPQPTPAAAGVADPPAPVQSAPVQSAPVQSAPVQPATVQPVAVQPATPGARPPHAAALRAPAIVGPVLPRSVPTSLRIPAIGVTSGLLHLGENPDGTLQVPPLDGSPQTDMAAWFDGSVTPGQVGPSIILGHVDSAASGPSVFFRLGALRPGDEVEVDRADGTVAVFTVTGVRRYAKAAFPTALVYGNTDDAALRLITCGGSFDSSTGHYLDNIVVFAHLTGVGHQGAGR